MFQNKTYCIFIVVLAMKCQIGFAQDIKADIVAINKTYHALDKFSMIFELNMFENYQSQKLYYTQKGNIYKSGKNYLQKFEDSECLNTPQYSVLLDKEDKEMVYAPRKGNFEMKEPGLNMNLDTVLMFCKSTQFKKVSDELVSYTFNMLESYPEYSQIVMYFDPKTHLVQKLVFYCDEDDISMDNEDEKLAKARIEINYKEINTKPTLNANDFSYERYLAKSGNNFELKSIYKGYHLTVLSF